MTAENPSEIAPGQDAAPAPRPKKRDVHGWVVLDKPVGMTSTHAVSVVKRAFSAKKAGHAGTLDPLASGLLPIALGEATKTVPFVMDGRKAYQFTVAWGTQTNTDDTEGSVIATSDKRPDEAAIVALLPRFTGTIMQTPPKFSAIKIAGERAYDLARDGEDVELQARPVEIDALSIVSHDGATTTFEAECGKGTYVRAIARDLGLALGCLGHVAHLRRTRVGPFAVADAAAVETLRESPESAAAALKPVKAADDGKARVRTTVGSAAPAPAALVKKPEASAIARAAEKPKPAASASTTQLIAGSSQSLPAGFALTTSR